MNDPLFLHQSVHGACMVPTAPRPAGCARRQVVTERMEYAAGGVSLAGRALIVCKVRDCVTPNIVVWVLHKIDLKFFFLLCVLFLFLICLCIWFWQLENFAVLAGITINIVSRIVLVCGTHKILQMFDKYYAQAVNMCFKFTQYIKNSGLQSSIDYQM